MSAANDINAAVVAIVEGAFGGKRCYARRGSDKNPFAGPGTGGPNGGPYFVWVMNEGRETEMAYSGKKFVKYPGRLVYITREIPGQRDPSGDVEGVISQAAKLFLAPRDNAGKPGLQGVGVFNDCEVQPLKPYDLPLKDAGANCSGLMITIETLEDSN